MKKCAKSRRNKMEKELEQNNDNSEKRIKFLEWIWKKEREKNGKTKEINEED